MISILNLPNLPKLTAVLKRETRICLFYWPEFSNHTLNIYIMFFKYPKVKTDPICLEELKQ